MENWAGGSRIGRENNYNVLRMIAAAAVMYGHMYVLIGSSAPVLYANEVNSIGFKMLMVLSGYMITQSCIYDSKVSRYAIKRVFRLIPALLFFSLAVIFIIGPVFTTLPMAEYFKHYYTRRYLYNVVLNPQYQLPAVFETNPYPYVVNGSLWGLPVEVSCYVLIYIILKLLCKVPWRKIIFSVIVVGICAMQVCRIVFFPTASYVFWGTDWFQAFVLYPYFFIGALYAVTNLKTYCNVQSAFVMLLVSVMFRSDVYAVNEVLAMIVLPYAIISFGEYGKPLFADWFKKMDITYGIYLWGFPVQQIVIKIIMVDMQYSMNVNAIFVISYAFTVLLAVVTWYIIERPAAVIMKKFLKAV